MKIKLITAVLLAGAAIPAYAQNTNTSASGSDSTANSGSASGASSDNFNTNSGGNNAGIGNSGAASDSRSTAITDSSASSNGNQQGQGQTSTNDQGQGQTQGQNANNDQGQGQTQTANAGSSDQGQMQGQSTNQSASQGNSQGVNITYNTTQRRKTITEVRAATPVMLAASSSFSSDYCGGTASGGASTSAPIGITIGASGPVFDNSCRYLRLSEKAGMLAANYHNMGYVDQSARAMSLMAWATCMAGPQQDNRKKGSRENVTMNACLTLGLLGSEGNAPQPPVTPIEAARPNMTPSPDGYSTTVPQPERLKTPRGEAGDTRPLASAK